MRIQQWGIVLLLSSSAACFGQTAVNGNCNATVGSVSGGNITIQCGLTPEDAKALARADKNSAAHNRILNEILARLKQQPKTDFSLGVVQVFLATIKGKQIPVEKWPETFGELSRDYLKLGAELKAIPVTSDAVKQLVERADDARKKGDLEQTDSLLQQAIELSSTDARKKRDDAKASAHQTAQLLESRASVAFTRLDRFQGARLLEEAFEWRKDDPDSDAIWWLIKAGDKVAEGGKTSEALRLYTKAQRAALRSAEDNPNDTNRQRDLSVSYEKIGNIQQAQGKLAEALQSFQSLIAITQKLAAADPSNTQWQRDLSVSYEKIGDIQQAENKLSEALKSYQSSMEIIQKLIKLDPSNTEWQRHISVSYNKIGDIQQAQGKLAEALQSFQAGMAIRQKLAAADPSNTQWQTDVAWSCSNIAGLGTAAGTVAYRRSLLQQGLSILKTLQSRDQLPPNKNWIAYFETELTKLK